MVALKRPQETAIKSSLHACDYYSLAPGLSQPGSKATLRGGALHVERGVLFTLRGGTLHIERGLFSPKSGYPGCRLAKKCWL